MTKYVCVGHAGPARQWQGFFSIRQRAQRQRGQQAAAPPENHLPSPPDQFQRTFFREEISRDRPASLPVPESQQQAPPPVGQKGHSPDEAAFFAGKRTWSA